MPLPPENYAQPSVLGPVPNPAVQFLMRPDLFDAIAQDIAALGLVGERDNALLVYLVLTSRRMQKPLHAILTGASSSGKNQIVDIVADLMPQDELYRITRATPKALYYMEEELSHRAIIITEREEQHDPHGNPVGSLAFRDLASSGRLRLLVPERDGPGHTTVEKVVEGPVAYVETTTSNLSEINNEDLNRMLVLHTDESAEQTGAIHARIAAEAAFQANDPVQTAQIEALHRNAQVLLLPSLEVRVSYATLIRLSTDSVASRRTYSHVLRIVKTVAYLR